MAGPSPAMTVECWIGQCLRWLLGLPFAPLQDVGIIEIAHRAPL
jgi:hypothetical protein